MSQLEFPPLDIQGNAFKNWLHKVCVVVNRLDKEHDPTGGHRDDVIDQAEISLSSAADANGEATRYEEFSAEHNPADGTQKAPSLRCALSLNADQAITTATWTAISWNNEEEDVDTLYDAGSPTRITLKKVGRWFICGSVYFAANATNSRIVEIRVNNSVVARGNEIPGHASNTTGLAFAAVVNASAITDYAEVFVYQASGGNLNVVGNTIQTRVSAYFLGTV